MGLHIANRRRIRLPEIVCRAYPAQMDIDPVIARLGEISDADESAIAERMLREFNGTIPDRHLLSEIGLSVAINRRGRSKGLLPRRIWTSR